MTKEGKKRWWRFEDIKGDKVVWSIALLLVFVSILCCFSSTSRLVMMSNGHLTRLSILSSQLKVVGAGLVVMGLLYNVRNIRIFKFFSKMGAPLTFILLLLLLLLRNVDESAPIKAIYINGSYRILRVGSLQIHVLEIAKVAMIMYTAWAVDAIKNKTLNVFTDEKITKWVFLYIPFVLTIPLMMLASNTAGIIMAGILFVMIGCVDKGRSFAIMSGLGVTMVALILSLYFVSGGKVFERLESLFNRVSFDHKHYERVIIDSEKHDSTFYAAVDEIRQSYTAKIAIKQGGLIGLGAGQSRQRYVVPDISEDYMFSFIVEEYGLLGGVFIIFLYLSLLARGAIIVRNSDDEFAKFSVAGLALLIGGQALIHFLVNVDLMPMTGQTLPLISHGNSAFLCFCVAFGVILSFSKLSKENVDKQQQEASPIFTNREDLDSRMKDLDDFESDSMENDSFYDEI